jgi:SAM-dependent methyltransferase
VVKKSTRHDWESYWGSKEKIEEIYSNADRIGRNLTSVLDLNGLKVLEVGAGTGRDSLPLTENGAIVFQLDYSFASLRLMKQAAGNLPVTLIGGDTFHLPFRRGTFDVIFHQGLLEHFKISRASDMIREQIRVLRDGGFLLIDIPQRYHIYTILKHILIALGSWFAGWERSFSYPELRRVLRSHGLEPVYAYGEWMRPSLLYRMIREAAKKLGITLPLNPPRVPLLWKGRDMLRMLLIKTPLPLYTGVCIGILGQKGAKKAIHNRVVDKATGKSV